MQWKFKEDAEPQSSSDGFYYGLFEGGYVDPEEVLIDEKQIKKLTKAIETVKDFYRDLEQNGLWEEM